MEEQKNDKSIRTSLLKSRESISLLRDSMNQDLFKVHSENLFQRRELLKHITFISGAIIGLTPIALSVDFDLPKASYFLWGIVLHFIVVILILSYLRERLDSEANTLQEQHDHYNQVAEEKIDLIDEYILKDSLTETDALEYTTRLNEMPGVKKLQEDYHDLKVQRENRKNIPLDYFSEFVFFIFLSACFLVIASFLDYPIVNNYTLITLIILFAFLAFSNTATFLSKHVSRFATFIRLIPKRKIALERINQQTIGDILEKENEFVLDAEKRYGDFFKNAASFNALLHSFIKEVKVEGWIFSMFLSQVRKHHTLALFSAVRRHHIQTQLDLRQTIEAGANAAYAIANPNEQDFVVDVSDGSLDAPKSLTEKRYQWLENNYKQHSDFLKNQKGVINRSSAHQNMIYGFQNFAFDEMTKARFQTPFFDIEDEYMIKTNLWFIGNLAWALLHLFAEVNKKYNMMTLTDDFADRLNALGKQNDGLKIVMSKNPRYIRAMAISNDKPQQ